MPPFKRLWLIPIAVLCAYWALVVITLHWTDAQQAPVFRAQTMALEFIAFAGCMVAALSFEGRDYLRTAWLLQGVSYLLLAIGVAARFAPVGTFPAATRAVLTFGSNFCQAFGAWLFARTWLVAGIELPGTRMTRAGVRLGALALSLILAGPALVIGVKNVVTGQGLSSLVGLFSALGDTVSLALIAPILMTALALRGGLVSWTWMFFTSTMVCWLVYDAYGGLIWLFADLGKTLPGWLEQGFEMFRIGACTITLSAGLAQRWTIRAQAT